MAKLVECVPNFSEGRNKEVGSRPGWVGWLDYRKLSAGQKYRKKTVHG